jgi:hypothetical protein
VSRGENPNTGAQVTEAVGAAVAADTFEFTVDLVASLTRQEALDGLEAIKRAIITGKWPPA